jgi:hypothetical protein
METFGAGGIVNSPILAEKSASMTSGQAKAADFSLSNFENQRNLLPQGLVWSAPGRNLVTAILTCSQRAYYTGGGSQLGMAIRCQSGNSKVHIRSKLSLSGSRITGNWEERTYNATGSATGTATPGRISIRVSGSISGSMVVNFSKSRQSVSISTSGSPLQAVSISLTRS